MKRFCTTLLALALSLAMCLAFAACSKPESAVSGQAHQSQAEIDEGYYYYESILLDKAQVVKAFKKANKDFPKYSVSPPEFHVTTEFMPAEHHDALYGTKVTVHIVGYTYGTVHDDEEDLDSQNEGFIVELTTDNEDMQALLDSYEKTWHVTGSYTEGGKYTEFLDWSKAKPMDITLTGTFGGADSEENFFTEPTT